MRVNMKGLNSVTRTLADGTERTYYYAWKGGPPLHGNYGTPEFLASYNAAVAQKIAPSEKILLSLLQKYQASEDFKSLRERTRKDYVKQIKVIESEFARFPVAGLTDRRATGIFLEWRDRLALRSRRQADYAYVVLARCLSWSLRRGLIYKNPCERAGRLYRDTRVEKVWSEDNEIAFLRSAPDHLRLPFLLALWTGQRQGDLLRLPWSAYDGKKLRFKQSKTGRRVELPVAEPLRLVLDAIRKTGPIILTSTDDRPWTPDGFRSSWRKACKRAGIVGLTFHDLRGTAVTRLALAECTEAEIAAITGHSLRDVGAILDAHYLKRDPRLAEEAIRKLERRTNFPK